MKKISLKDLILNQVDQLSRDQLKNVLGGYAGSSTGGGATTTDATPCGESDCTSDADCGGENPTCHKSTCQSNGQPLNYCGV